MSRRDTACGLLAVAAVVIYMLACGSRPAWSPDSKRVVFAFLDQETETSGLALYDLPTGQVERILQNKGKMIYQPVWLGKKEQVIALAARGETAVDIIQVDLETGEDRLIKSVAAKQAITAMLVPPVLVEERYLLFSFDPEEGDLDYSLHRLDLQTGELNVVPDSADRYLFEIGESCFYLGGGEDGLELGSMDTRRLKFRRLAKLDKEIYGDLKLGLAGKGNGAEFAVVTVREEDGKELVILIINRRGKVVKEIEISAGVDVDSTKLSHMVYGPKGKSLWVPVVKAVAVEGAAEGTDEKKVEFRLSLLEVDVRKGTHRTVIESWVSRDDEFLMKPRVSPDGKWLAVDVLAPQDEPRSVLYLVDLTSAERKVTKVALAEVEAEPAELEKTE